MNTYTVECPFCNIEQDMIKSDYNYTRILCANCRARYTCNNFTKVVDCINEIPHNSEEVDDSTIQEVLDKGINGDGIGVSKKSISIDELNKYGVEVQ